MKSCRLLFVAFWMVLLSLTTYGKPQQNHIAPTVLEEIEQMQRTDRCVLLSRKQMPAMPKVGWQTYVMDGDDYREKVYEKIAISLDGLQDISLKNQVAGFTYALAKVKQTGPFKYGSDWVCAAHGGINVILGSVYGSLNPGAAYPSPTNVLKSNSSGNGDFIFEARVHRTSLVAANQRVATKRRLQGAERRGLHGFFKASIIDPPTYGKDNERVITATWGRYVHRIDFTRRTSFSSYFEVPKPLQRFAPSIRSAWVEFTVRVDQKGLPVAPPPLFGRVIAFETTKQLYLTEQRAVPATFFGTGGARPRVIDLGDK